jgi:CHAD domain-containing protein
VPPRDDAVREIRKSVKKTRAILQLIDADNGQGLAESAKRLNAINRRLSELRDADVMLETLHTLRTRDRRVLNDRCFARLHRRLSSHRKSTMRAARRKRPWRRVAQSVRRIRQSVKQWKPKHPPFGAIAAGIRLSHQRGRQAMARARRNQRAADFHEWRKQIKALWYQLRLVEASSSRMRRNVKALGRAEEWLGNEHNIVVLCDELSQGEPRGESRIDLDRVRLAGDCYQSELRTKAAEHQTHLCTRAA